MARTPSIERDADVILVKSSWLDALYELQALYELEAAPDDVMGLAPADKTGPWRSRIMVAAGLALVLASVSSVAEALVPAAASAPSPLERSAALAPDIAAPVPAAVKGEPLPARVSIPAIRVASQLVSLGLNANGGLQDLKDFDRPGWYAGGPLPGDPGAALIVGHVDSYEGPAVFQRLEQLSRGDVVSVQRTDGSVVRFVVDRLASYPKDRFPTNEVFAASAPELRLITCFGSFDTARKSYTRNLVVYASLVSPEPPSTHSRLRTAPHQKELL